MKEHPLLFKGEMVRAILAGRKTQTRQLNLKKKYAVGDRIWVKETWAWPFRDSERVEQDLRFAAIHEGAVTWKWKPSIYMPRWVARIILEITAVRDERLQDISEEDSESEGVISNQEYADRAGEADLWPCPMCAGFQLYMAGSLMGASEVDCRYCDTAKKRYRQLWTTINGSESWDENPMVKVITFKRVTA